MSLSDSRLAIEKQYLWLKGKLLYIAGFLLFLNRRLLTKCGCPNYFSSIWNYCD